MTDHPVPPNYIEHFAILIFRINAALMQNGNNIASAVGQSSARWHILGQVEFQPQTVAMIARNMGQARQSVQRLTDILVTEGLIKYMRHPTDNRTKLVTVTSKGRRVISEINKRNVLWVNDVMPLIDDDELRDMNVRLTQIAQIIEHHQYREEV